MRGTLVHRRREVGGDGIIPAYAGNTDERVRSGIIPAYAGNTDERVRSGIIPAYAGNTPIDGGEMLNARDHPRVCGEHDEHDDTIELRTGSSPRMRGTPR